MKLYLIAGEPSGDRLGAALMAGLNQLAPGVQYGGVAGPDMQVQGMASQFPMQELSVMGLAEILPKYFALKRRIRQCAEAIADQTPDALITVDSPDFCLRVAALARAARPGLRTIHYVAPSVWAWRPGRAARMARHIDHVLALLPFEPPYMHAAGMSCEFVGHPVVAERRATPADVAAFRLERGLGRDTPLILALPGSRKGEVERLAPRFGETLRLVIADHPKARVLVPTVAAVLPLVRELIRAWPGDPLLVLPGEGAAKAAAFAAATVALAASGTVSLELAAARTPMVIGYDMAWATRRIMAQLIRVETVTLVNLVSETRAVPEFLGADCRPEPMAKALLALLGSGTERAAQLAAMDLTMERLGQGGEPPGLRAARSVLAQIVPAGSSDPA